VTGESKEGRARRGEQGGETTEGRARRGEEDRKIDGHTKKHMEYVVLQSSSPPLCKHSLSTREKNRRWEDKGRRRGSRKEKRIGRMRWKEGKGEREEVKKLV
jgi:hypothetical protein